MSEANNPTNSAFSEAVNSVNSTKTDQANVSLFDSPNEPLAPAIVPTDQAENPHSVNPNSNQAPEYSDCRLPYPNLIEVSENKMAVFAPCELAELVALIEEVHSSNSDLVQQVTELTQALGECQKAAQSYEKRAHTAESMFTQQTQELADAQDQKRCLFHELETIRQTNTRQQILIETLTDQLENSQERVAQMERECSLTQASYNEQSYQLAQIENTCRELRTRLTRQQRHTLQFKVALEKSLEVSVPNYQSPADTEWESGDLRNTPCLPPFLPQVQPIPPWSAQPQFLVNELPVWEPLSSSPSPDSSFFEWSVEDLSTPLEEEPLTTVKTDLEVQFSESDSNEVEQAQLQDLVSLLAALEEPVTVIPKGDTVTPCKACNSPDQVEEPPWQSEDAPQDLLTNWPSVVVYPSRPPKGRKSLAEIELPPFS